MNDTKFKILSIDVWGNEKNGWERNNWFHEGYIYLENEDEEDIIDHLIELGHLSKEAKGKVEAEDFGGSCIDIIRISDGYPIFELQECYD